MGSFPYVAEMFWLSVCLQSHITSLADLVTLSTGFGSVVFTVGRVWPELPLFIL